ncbi:2OG-Fe(II) oxygenase superfamily protein [Chitinophaga eiseniae]|uniref:2OG-Fe(II) oxygenase superfamily protein n=1 Tax=Chitinophaga eiseniae TaxID=634771 RepID=A0A1T4NXL0_9BACT|nr:2OG-Fe(II) oxygenase [Chitinophaga eiseniae]SJZ84024.1 2OG-Fe(II) oxygenase superfamily protein [Chitinophaga eiseniae]
MKPGFHTIAHHYAVNLVLYFLGLHNINMGRLKVRTALYAKETFPELSIQVISVELQEWGIRHTLKTAPCSITGAGIFPTMAVVSIQEQEALVVVEKVEGQLVHLQYASADRATFAVSELTVLHYLDIHGIVIDKAFCASNEQDDLTKREAYADTIFAVEDFFSAEECGYMINYCEQHHLFNRSMTGAADGTSEVTGNRTSYSAFITNCRQDTLFNNIVERAADLMEVEAACVEDLQCVRYGPGQEYRPHFDSFERGPKRKATLLVYLNDDFEGGETIFPEIGVSVSPRKGMALAFMNLDEQHNDLIYSLHGGAPVTDGTKFACNIWIH